MKKTTITHARTKLAQRWDKIERTRKPVTISRTGHEDMVLMDVFYINNWSFSLDLRILVRTFFIVMTGKGAL